MHARRADVLEALNVSGSDDQQISRALEAISRAGARVNLQSVGIIAPATRLAGGIPRIAIEQCRHLRQFAGISRQRTEVADARNPAAIA